MQRPLENKGRIEAIDLARGAAIIAMAVYHFAWDLGFFGYVDAATINQGGWRFFARSIASSFLFLVGVSLYLAHASAIRWPPFLKRFVMIFGAALAITVATYLAMPQSFIFFGILHHIAIASLLGLAFLRAPVWLLLVIALIVIAGPQFLRTELFVHPTAWWIGLSPVNPTSNDYVPIFPWFGSVLLGIATAKIASQRGWIERLRQWPAWNWTRPIQTAGRNSLIIYLVHQPLLIASIGLFSLVFPPQAAAPEEAFVAACVEQCREQQRSEQFCQAYCGCVRDRVVAVEQTLGHAVEDEQRLYEITMQCSMEMADPLEQEDAS